MTAYCECCWITAIQPSVSDPLRYCRPCRGHIHSTANARADHRALVAVKLDVHDREVEGLKKSLEDRSRTIVEVTAERDELVREVAAGFSDAPTSRLADLLSNAVVADLHKQLESSYYSRDRAMAAIWRVEERHHDVGGSKCRCSKSLRSCGDYTAIEFFLPTYYAWENRQIKLMKEGKSHGLPSDHPESQKHFTDAFRWKGRHSTVANDRRSLSA